MSAQRKLDIETLSADCLKTVLPGCTIQLQFGTPDSVRVTGRLIGYDHNKYMIVKLNEQEASHRFEKCLFEGNSLVARMLIEGGRGECIAFKSTIRWRGYNPLNFLYLAFPMVVQKCDYRTHPRVPTCIVANLTDTIRSADNHSQRVNGYLRDVSLGGCCFEFQLPEHHRGISSKPLQVTVGENQPFTAEVKNQRTISDSRIAVGMQFRTSLSDVKTLLSRLYIAPEMLVSQ